MRLNPSVLSTAAPPIPQAQAWRAAYLALTPNTTFGPLLDLSQGVPSSPPPRLFSEQLAKVVLEDPTSARYGAILGEGKLRRALADEWRDVYDSRGEWPATLEDNGVGVGAEDLGIVCGANMAFMAALQTLCQPGDAVLLPTPAYFNHSMTLAVLSLQAVPLPCAPEAGYVPCVDAARRALERRAASGASSCSSGSSTAGPIKAIILVTPNNPTGRAYPPATLEAFARLAEEFDLALIVDETYRDFVKPVSVETPASAKPDLKSGLSYHRGTPHALFSNPTWRDTVITLFSFSKSYCIPGHRLGVVCASPLFLKSLSTVLDCMQINPPRPAQLALAEVLPQLREGVVERSRAYERLLERFESVLPNGWEVLSKGAFYAFVRHPFGRRRPSFAGEDDKDDRSLDKLGPSSLEVARILGEKYGVVVLPGSFFRLGSPPSSPSIATQDESSAVELKADEKPMLSSKTERSENLRLPVATAAIDESESDDCLRFAVANITEAELDLLGPRLELVSAADFA